MRAVYIKEFGDLDALEICEIPAPAAPSFQQVLVNVHAAGLNRADLLQVRGAYPPPPGYSPNIPGLEFAGRIESVGPDVDRFKIGDRVFGITSGEAQAEYLLASMRQVTRIPDNLSFTEAAAVPEAFMTAHDALFANGHLREGGTVLIHAVGSGVGLAALQLSKAAGALVIGTSRTIDKLDKCRRFGLDHGIPTDGNLDFSKTVMEITNGHGADVIVDLVGASYFEMNLRALAVKGRLILVGLTSGRTTEFDLGLALQKRATIIGTVMRARSADEKADVTRLFSDSVVPLFVTGDVTPNVDKIFPVSEVKEAYRYLGSNRSFGKVVLEF